MRISEFYSLYQEKTSSMKTTDEKKQCLEELMNTVLEIKTFLPLTTKIGVARAVTENCSKKEKWYSYLDSALAALVEDALIATQYTGLEFDYDTEEDEAAHRVSLQCYDQIREMGIVEQLYKKTLDIDDLREMIRCEIKKFNEINEIFAIAGKWLSKEELDTYMNEFPSRL